MKQWEYKIVDLSGGMFGSKVDSPTERDLNELGDNGWELSTTMADGTHHDNKLVFKRPKE